MLRVYVEETERRCHRIYKKRGKKSECIIVGILVVYMHFGRGRLRHVRSRDSRRRETIGRKGERLGNSFIKCHSFITRDINTS